MASLIEQLQQDALDPTVSVSMLLRKVKLAAVKLNLGEVAAWVDAELTGYKNAEVPEYRQLFGQPKGLDPYHGWQPIGGNAQFIETISKANMGQPLPGLEDLVTERVRGKNGSLFFPFTPKQAGAINAVLNHPCHEMGLFIGTTAVVDIVEAVRTLVLNWALDLEKAGIVGSGLSFSSEEQRKASRVTVRIDNFSGNFHAGDVDGPAARVNMASTDSSTNIVGDEASVFAPLEAALQSVVEQRDRELLADLVAEMRRSQGSSGYLAAYQRFIASAADYMTIVAPFLPALTGLIAGQ